MIMVRKCAYGLSYHLINLQIQNGVENTKKHATNPDGLIACFIEWEIKRRGLRRRSHHLRCLLMGASADQPAPRRLQVLSAPGRTSAG